MQEKETGLSLHCPKEFVFTGRLAAVDGTPGICYWYSLNDSKDLWVHRQLPFGDNANNHYNSILKHHSNNARLEQQGYYHRMRGLLPQLRTIQGVQTTLTRFFSIRHSLIDNHFYSPVDKYTKKSLSIEVSLASFISLMYSIF